MSGTDKRHWQHRAITKDVLYEAESFNGLTPFHIRFLLWLQTRAYPIGKGAVIRDFLQRELRDRAAHEQARLLLETLALNKYLLRGRHRTPKTDWVTTNYRLSAKAKRILAQHGPNSSTSAPTP